MAKPNGDPLHPARLNKTRIKIKTKSYFWNYSKALEETVSPSSDGFIIVSRNFSSSVNYVGLKVSFISLLILSAKKGTNLSRESITCNLEDDCLKLGVF